MVAQMAAQCDSISALADVRCCKLTDSRSRHNWLVRTCSGVVLGWRRSSDGVAGRCLAGQPRGAITMQSAGEYIAGFFGALT